MLEYKHYTNQIQIEIKARYLAQFNAELSTLLSPAKLSFYQIKNNQKIPIVDWQLCLQKNQVTKQLFSDKILTKLFHQINQAKTRSLEHLLYGLNIANIGFSFAKLLAKQFLNIANLQKITPQTSVQIDKIGTKISTHLHAWFTNKQNIALLAQLKALGVNDTYLALTKSIINPKYDYFKNKRFCLTGKFNISRRMLTELLENTYQIQICNTLNTNVDYLLVGKSPTAWKVAKAQKLKINLVYEKFW